MTNQEKPCVCVFQCNKRVYIQIQINKIEKKRCNGLLKRKVVLKKVVYVHATFIVVIEFFFKALAVLSGRF